MRAMWTGKRCCKDNLRGEMCGCSVPGGGVQLATWRAGCGPEQEQSRSPAAASAALRLLLLSRRTIRCSAGSWKAAAVSLLGLCTSRRIQPRGLPALSCSATLCMLLGISAQPILK